jgi:hypothetical protein
MCVISYYAATQTNPSQLQSVPDMGEYHLHVILYGYRVLTYQGRSLVIRGCVILLGWQTPGRSTLRHQIVTRVSVLPAHYTFISSQMSDPTFRPGTYRIINVAGGRAPEISERDHTKVEGWEISNNKSQEVYLPGIHAPRANQ